MPRRTKEQIDSVAFYLLTRRQTIRSVAFLTDKSEEEVRRLVEIGRVLIGDDPGNKKGPDDIHPTMARVRNHRTNN
jgi:hypothetical protein